MPDLVYPAPGLAPPASSLIYPRPGLVYPGPDLLPPAPGLVYPGPDLLPPAPGLVYPAPGIIPLLLTLSILLLTSSIILSFIIVRSRKVKKVRQSFLYDPSWSKLNEIHNY